MTLCCDSKIILHLKAQFVCLLVCLLFRAIVVTMASQREAVFATAAVTHQLTTSGLKCSDEPARDELSSGGGDRDVTGHKLVDWEMFSGDEHVRPPVEQSGSSAAASNCVFPAGESASLACSHQTDVPRWRPEEEGGRERGRGVCQTSVSRVIIKITPVAGAHGFKKSQLESPRCVVSGRKQPTASWPEEREATQIRSSWFSSPLFAASPAPFHLFFFLQMDGLICYSDAQNIRLI